MKKQVFSNFLLGKKKILLIYLTISILLAINVSSLGCCEPVCLPTTKDLCYGDYYEDTPCYEIDKCNMGCCIDNDGYCLSNYLKGNCIKNNGTFITRECPDVYHCTKEIVQPSVENYTGFEVIFRAPTVTDGFPVIEPKSASYGSFFSVGYYFYDKSEVAIAKARIKDGNDEIQRLTLYDDGYHGDRNSDDNLYSDYFDSSIIPGFNNFKQLNIDFIITLRNLTIIEKNNLDYLTISNTKCFPLNEWEDPSSNYNLVFISNNYQYMSDFASDVKEHIDGIKSIQPFANYTENFNFYRVDNQNILTKQQAINNVKQECYFFNPQKDMIIMLDKNSEYCENSLSFASTNPDSIYSDQNILNKDKPDFNDIGDYLENICYFIVTPKEFFDYLTEISDSPEIKILTPNGTVFNTSNPTIEFEIKDDKDHVIDYSLVAFGGYADIIVEGKALTHVETQKNFNNLTDGYYDVWIEAEDNDGNFNGSNLITIFVRSNISVSAPPIIMPSPPLVEYEDILLSILVMFLTFLILIAIILYEKN